MAVVFGYVSTKIHGRGLREDAAIRLPAPIA